MGKINIRKCNDVILSTTLLLQLLRTLNFVAKKCPILPGASDNLKRFFLRRLLMSARQSFFSSIFLRYLLWGWITGRPMPAYRTTSLISPVRLAGFSTSSRLRKSISHQSEIVLLIRLKKNVSYQSDIVSLISLA